MTQTTIESPREIAPQSGFRRFVIAGVAIALAMATIILAWPRLIAGATEGPLEETLQSLLGPNPAADSMVQRVLAVKEQVVLIHPNSKTWADIGFLRMRKSMELGTQTKDGKLELEESIAAHRAALNFEPGNAYVWTRLAQDLLVRDGAGTDGLGSILETTVRFSPYDSRLVLARVDMALAAWGQLPDATRALMNGQIHLAASQSPTALAKLTRQRFALNQMIDLLSDDPKLLKRFIYAYVH